MKKLGALLILFFGLVSSALAQSAGWPPPAGAVAFLCVYNASPPALTTTNVAYAQCDSSGNLRVSGSLAVAGTTSNASSGVATSATNLPTTSYNFGFNGTTWDQLQVDANKNLKIVSSSQYPSGATAITGNATGTTGAVVGTLANASTKTTFICGFAVSATGGVATLGPITVAGLVGSSMVFQLFSTATGANLSQQFSPCVPASTTNTAITITTTADATASAVDVNSWGYQL